MPFCSGKWAIDQNLCGIVYILSHADVTKYVSNVVSTSGKRSLGLCGLFERIVRGGGAWKRPIQQLVDDKSWPGFIQMNTPAHAGAFFLVLTPAAEIPASRLFWVSSSNFQAPFPPSGLENLLSTRPIFHARLYRTRHLAHFSLQGDKSSRWLLCKFFPDRKLFVGKLWQKRKSCWTFSPRAGFVLDIHNSAVPSSWKSRSTHHFHISCSRGFFYCLDFHETSTPHPPLRAPGDGAGVKLLTNKSSLMEINTATFFLLQLV